MNHTMPSDRRAINVRLPEDESAEFDALQKELSEKLEMELSASDVVRRALKALRRELRREEKDKGKMA